MRRGGHDQHRPLAQRSAQGGAGAAEHGGARIQIADCLEDKFELFREARIVGAVFGSEIVDKPVRGIDQARHANIGEAVGQFELAGGQRQQTDDMVESCGHRALQCHAAVLPEQADPIETSAFPRIVRNHLPGSLDQIEIHRERSNAVKPRLEEGKAVAGDGAMSGFEPINPAIGRRNPHRTQCVGAERNVA